MPHKRKPRRSKMDQQLITLEPENPANVIVFPSDNTPLSRKGNLAPDLNPQ